MTALMLLGVAWTILQWTPDPAKQSLSSLRSLRTSFTAGYSQPLVMKGGDPYIRALMRTISAAESNLDQPYAVLYGGKVVDDLNQHPGICVTIVTGPNKGNCTTAAGRYQFLDTTWEAKAERYHPRPPAWYERWKEYSFQPVYQDEVVYAWLSDSSAWGADLSQMLQEGRIHEVLKMLSGTWTSLGYGIETNSMSSRLPDIYAAMLKEELKSGQNN